MRAVVVEVDVPRRDQIACMAQVAEQVLIQTFIPHAPVEAFDKSILHGLARRDLMSVNLAVFLPLQDCV